MSKVAIIVLANNDTAEDRGRILHALYAAKELKDANQEVKVIFEGAGVNWLTEFHDGESEFSKAFSDLWIEVRDTFMGASNYVATKRFNAVAAVEGYGLPLLGEEGGHYSVGTLIQDGYQSISF
jgi:hypothetical protein